MLLLCHDIFCYIVFKYFLVVVLDSKYWQRNENKINSTYPPLFAYLSLCFKILCRYLCKKNITDIYSKLGTKNIAKIFLLCRFLASIIYFHGLV